MLMLRVKYFTALCLLGLPFLVLAQPSPDPANLDTFMQSVAAAAQLGHWRAVAVLGVIGLVYLARRCGGGYLPFLRTDLGGSVLAFVTGLLTTVTPLLLSSAPLTSQALISAVLSGAAPAGLYTLGRRVILAGVTQAPAAQQQQQPTPSTSGTPRAS